MKYIITIVIILAAIAGGVYYFKNQPTSSVPTQTATSTSANAGTSTTSETTSETVGEKSYTLADVQTHATATSCWTIVNNKVYDVTTWINRHPGGSKAILSMCGKDATGQFEDQHGGQYRPEQELAGFQIGVLLLGL